ncbi:MAG: hypothetical protein KF795_21590 [Labilithrix sp.]|nr:hypothetical protein [Labilithrix sp.]
MVGRWWAKRRGEADKPGADEGGRKDAPAEDPDEARARAEVEAEVPRPSDDASSSNTPAPDAAASATAATAPATRAAEAAKRRARPVTAAPRVPLDGFVCQLGDVLIRLTGEEAWLAGGVVLSEEVPVAILFVAPDADRDCAVYVRARPRETLFWLEPLDPSAILVGGEPPSSVEHGGVRFDRERRLPLRPRRIGVGAPDVGDAVVVAEYASAGAERLLLLKANSGVVRAYRGLELERSSYEVIASGDATL